MRSTFWPNRICERQSSQNRHTGLKFSPKRENRALFIKLVHSALFRSCGTRFGQIAFVSVKVLKIVKLAQNSLQNGKTVRLPWKVPFYYNFHKKILQNALFRSCAARFGQIAFFTVKVLKIAKLGWNSLQNGKTVRLPWKVPFYYNFHKKILQNALFRSCGERFGQIAFFSVKVLKIAKLGWNSLQDGKTVRFPWKLYKTLFSGHAQHVLAKSHFSPSKFSKSSKLGWNSLQDGKTVRFPWKLYKTLFSGHAQHVLAKSHFWASKFSKSQNWPPILENGKTVRFPWKLYKTLFSGHAQHVLAKSHFWAAKFSKSWNWPQILFKTVKQCAFHENCTKRSFQVMRSTF